MFILKVSFHQAFPEHCQYHTNVVTNDKFISMPLTKLLYLDAAMICDCDVCRDSYILLFLIVLLH